LEWVLADEANAAHEAVEVLEDQLAQAEERIDSWKEAAKTFYKETLNLKAKVRELNSHTFAIVNANGRALDLIAIQDGRCCGDPGDCRHECSMGRH
jgi:chromosome segregation ATPase